MSFITRTTAFFLIFRSRIDDDMIVPLAFSGLFFIKQAKQVIAGRIQFSR